MHTGNRSYKLNPSQMLSVTTLSSGYFERIPFTSVGGDLPSLWARSHRSILLISYPTLNYSIDNFQKPSQCQIMYRILWYHRIIRGRIKQVPLYFVHQWSIYDLVSMLWSRLGKSHSLPMHGPNSLLWSKSLSILYSSSEILPKQVKRYHGDSVPWDNIK
jgi:hypothetical protein